MRNKALHVLVASVLVFFLLALGDFLPFWMPDMNEMLVLLIVSILMLVWVGFVMLETGTDEREIMLRMHAGRIAYLSGIGMLLTALIRQGLDDAIDPWIIATLAIMVVTKLGARIYIDRE